MIYKKKNNDEFNKNTSREIFFWLKVVCGTLVFNLYFQQNGG